MEPIKLILLNNLPLTRAFVGYILAAIKLLHTIQMAYGFLHKVYFFGINKEAFRILLVELSNDILNIGWVEYPLPSFKYFNVILNVFNSFSHLLELDNLISHLFASNKWKFSDVTHYFCRKIILEINFGLVFLFVASHPQTWISYLLLEWVIF